MSNINLKKLILPNLPYLLFVYLFDKAAQAARLAPGADFSAKVLSIGEGFTAAFSSFVPSLAPVDILVGVAGAVLIRLIVYFKGKNAKKYRKNVEYGSAPVSYTHLDVYKRQALYHGANWNPFRRRGLIETVSSQKIVVIHLIP